jgi:predicted kinase
VSAAVGEPPEVSASGPGGTLVCVGGSPGAGKTTVGALVAARGGLCLVDLDSVTTPLVEAFAASLGTVADLDSPRFAALRDARYACLGEVAADNLRAGRDVVAVAPFTAEAADAVAWRALGHTWGAARVVLCWLDLDPAEAAARAAARGLPRDLAKAARADGGPSAGGGRTASRVVDRARFDVVADGGQASAETSEVVLGVLAAPSRPGTMPP